MDIYSISVKTPPHIYSISILILGGLGGIFLSVLTTRITTTTTLTLLSSPTTTTSFLWQEDGELTSALGEAKDFAGGQGCMDLQKTTT